MEFPVDMSVLTLFLPTFFLVSLTPGMCMTLAMSLGMSIGVKRTFNMMIGELIGVALVAIATIIGIASLMLQYPNVFQIFKYAGGLYLFYLGVQMWLSRGKMAASCEVSESFEGLSNKKLALQGFVTAVANPKGWAFFIALLPPFINEAKPLIPQVSVLLFIMLSFELICMFLYASGGSTLRKFLQKSNNVKRINKVAGTLMMAVGVWLGLE